MWQRIINYKYLHTYNMAQQKSWKKILTVYHRYIEDNSARSSENIKPALHCVL